MKTGFALKIDDLDNVATIFGEDLTAGTTVTVQDKKGNSQTVTLLDPIPYGHKVALCPIKKGGLIIKYGECIGTASCDIKTGSYVHIHNLDARRGRGDLKGGAL